MNRVQIERFAEAGARSAYLGDGRLVARVLGKYTMVLDGTDLSLTPHLALSGFWESWVTSWVMSQSLTGQRIINVGANCGYFTMLFADLVGSTGRVVAMEPQAHLAAMCAESALLNGFHDRVKVVPFAAGAETKTATLHVPVSTNASAQLERAPDLLIGEMREEEVTVVRAESVMPDATFAFVDAEGYEPEVWAGMTEMKQLRTLVLEWTPGRYRDARAFYDALCAAGFRTSYIDPQNGETPATGADVFGADPDYWCMLALRR